MYADMVGYSRLIGLDDAGTLERLRTLRGTLIDPAKAADGRAQRSNTQIPSTDMPRATRRRVVQAGLGALGYPGSGQDGKPL